MRNGNPVTRLIAEKYRQAIRREDRAYLPRSEADNGIGFVIVAHQVVNLRHGRPVNLAYPVGW